MKVVRMEDGRIGAYGLDLQTGEFVLDMLYLHRATQADNDAVVELSEAEFLARVEQVRKEIDAKKSG